MKIKELKDIQKKYIKDVKSYFERVSEELQNKIKYKVEIEEIKAESDEMWADYNIKIGKTKFMLDCSPFEDYFRLAVFEGTKLAAESIKKYKGEWDDIFENYVLFCTKDLDDVIDFFKWVEENEK